MEVFVLTARRSNYSDTCPDSLLRLEYPPYRYQNLQAELAPDGSAEVHNVENGDFPAFGIWQPGTVVYKTEEQCSIH